MLISRSINRSRAVLLGAAAVLLTPGLGQAQFPEVRHFPEPFTGYSPSAYSSYVTVGPPSHLTSINYPTVYGMRTYGVQWPNARLSSITKAPFSTYPETYSPIAPPSAAAFSQSYYQTGPGGALLHGSELRTGTANTSTLAPTSPVTIDINVPEDAEVTIQGKKMNQSGSARQFTSPYLNPAFAYSYDIVATWNENGQAVTQNRRVVVRPGDHETVTFTASAPPASPQPATTSLRTRE